MEKGKISVIVPIYMAQEYLPACIDSILAQTYTELEVILVDDGSPDRCGQICDEYAERDKRIRVIHKENNGVSSARNAGLDAAVGEYIAFVDSDDTILPDMYRTLYDMAVNFNADIVLCNNTITSSKGKYVQRDYSHYEGKIFSGYDMVSMCFDMKLSITAWGKLYRSELFSELRFPVGRLFEDYMLAPEVYRSRKTAVITNRPLYNYIIRPGGIMWKTRRDDIHFKKAEQQARFERFNKYIDVYPECGRALYLGVLDIIRDNVKAYLKSGNSSAQMKKLLEDSLLFLSNNKEIIKEKCNPTLTERFRMSVLGADNRIGLWMFLVLNKIDILLKRT